MGLFGKRKPQPSEPSEGPSTDYIFAHMALRGLAQASPIQFLAIAPSPDFPKLLDPLLADLAEDCGQPTSFSSSDLRVRAGRVKPKSAPGESYPMILLELPEPQKPSEAHMIGFVVMIDPATLKEPPPPEEIETRYFVLEKSFEFDGVPHNVLGEWGQGQFQHINHGEGPARNPKEFVKAISRLL